MMASDALVEEAVYQIREARAIQLARAEAYLDGLTLAAEQVQDMRLTLVETPTPVTGWEAAGSVLLTFVLESTIAGKALARTAQAIFTPVLRMNAVFRALPKSREGQELLEQAQRLARMNEPVAPFGVSRGPGLPAQRIVPSARQSRAVTVAAVLQRGAGGPGLNALGKENVVLYHAWIQSLISRGSDTDMNLAAAAKAIREAATKTLTTPSPDVMDSESVALREAAYDYASNMRLSIRLQHDRLEMLVRRGGGEPTELGLAVSLCELPELFSDRALDKGVTAAQAARREFARFFEAIIWAQMYRFNEETGAGRGFPHVHGDLKRFVLTGDAHKDRLLSNYWVERFADAVAPRAGLEVEVWRKQSVAQRLSQLRDLYLGRVRGAMPRL